jgi:hypothetical protein
VLPRWSVCNLLALIDWVIACFHFGLRALLHGWSDHLFDRLWRSLPPNLYPYIQVLSRPH